MVFPALVISSVLNESDRLWNMFTINHKLKALQAEGHVTRLVDPKYSL